MSLWRSDSRFVTSDLPAYVRRMWYRHKLIRCSICKENKESNNLGSLLATKRDPKMSPDIMSRDQMSPDRMSLDQMSPDRMSRDKMSPYKMPRDKCPRIECHRIKCPRIECHWNKCPRIECHRIRMPPVILYSYNYCIYNINYNSYKAPAICDIHMEG